MKTLTPRPPPPSTKKTTKTDFSPLHSVVRGVHWLQRQQQESCQPRVHAVDLRRAQPVYGCWHFARDVGRRRCAVAQDK